MDQNEQKCVFCNEPLGPSDAQFAHRACGNPVHAAIIAGARSGLIDEVNDKLRRLEELVRGKVGKHMMLIIAAGRQFDGL